MAKIERLADGISRNPQIVALGDVVLRQIIGSGMTNGEAVQGLLQIMLHMLTEACKGDALRAADALVEMVRMGRKTLRESQSLMVVERGPASVKEELEEDAERLRWLLEHGVTRYALTMDAKPITRERIDQVRHAQAMEAVNGKA